MSIQQEAPSSEEASVYHIVAVEDSPVIRRLIEVSLDQLDVVVATIGTGGEACERMLQAPPDLLLLDLGLPDMEGWDVVAFVQENRALDGLPIVLLTGHTDLDDRVRADEWGVARYVVKPFRPADLRSIITDLLPFAAHSGV